MSTIYDKIDIIKKLNEDGYTYEQIAREIGYSDSAVKKLFKKEGIEKKKKKSIVRPTDEQILYMQDSFRRGIKVSKIAKEVGFEIQTVYKYLRDMPDYEECKRTVDYDLAEITPKILRDYKNGLSFEGIRNKYGVGDCTISRIINKYASDMRRSDLRRISKSLIDNVKRLDIAGVSRPYIASTLNIPEGTVSYVLNHHTNNKNLTEQDVIRVIRMYNCKMPESCIMREFDISRMCFNRIIMAYKDAVKNNKNTLNLDFIK